MANKQQPADRLPMREAWRTVLTKVIGMELGALAGALVAICIWWLQPLRPLAYAASLGVVVGAAAGGMLAGGSAGKIGWSIALATLIGCVIGLEKSPPKGHSNIEVITTASGLMLGFLVGVILEISTLQTAKRQLEDINR